MITPPEAIELKEAFSGMAQLSDLSLHIITPIPTGVGAATFYSEEEFAESDEDILYNDDIFDRARRDILSKEVDFTSLRRM